MLLFLPRHVVQISSIDHLAVKNALQQDSPAQCSRNSDENFITKILLYPQFLCCAMCTSISTKKKHHNTVDRKNPAPVDMVNFPNSLQGFSTIPGGEPRRIFEPSTVPSPQRKHHVFQRTFSSWHEFVKSIFVRK